MAKKKRVTICEFRFDSEDGAILPPVPDSAEPIALFCSDLHLSLRPPVARAGEKDWLAAQARPLWEIKVMAKEMDIPVICAGDIFDRWNSPPELINWAIVNLPTMYAVPGQHDMPYHNPELLYRSAYWTLVEAKRIRPLLPDIRTIPPWPNGGQKLALYGFPWGTSISPPEMRESHKLCVAVAHQYVWTPSTGYPGAPEAGSLDSKLIFGELDGYDLVFFGDNHIPFTTYIPTHPDQPVIVNCGSVIRRKSNEDINRPIVTILYDSGHIKIHALDISEDIIEHTTGDWPEDPLEDSLQLGEFLEEMRALKENNLDFEVALLRALNERSVSPSVRQIILEAMGHERFA